MHCHRCDGIMIFKKFCDYGGYSYGWKCIRCGEIIDEVPENPQRRERKQEWEKTLSNDMEERSRIKLNLNS